MAANLLVKRLSVQIDPSPPGPWTVSTNLCHFSYEMVSGGDENVPIAPSKFSCLVLRVVCTQ